MSKTYEPHPLSLVMPPMSDDEYFQLINSIVAHGQMEPIVILDGQILDGRHRYAACRQLGIEPIIREYSYENDGPSPATFSLVKNTHRRHLTTSQRAMVAAAILPFFEAEARENQRKAGGDQKAKLEHVETTAPVHSHAKAAEEMHVSASSVQRAAKLAEEAPELAEEVKAGKKTLNAAKTELEEKKKNAAPSIIPAENQRKAAFAEIAERHGEEFASAVVDGRKLKTLEDFEDFMKLSEKEQLGMMDFILRGWTIRKAQRWLANAVDEETKVEDLIVRLNAARKKTLSWTVGKFQVSVKFIE